MKWLTMRCTSCRGYGQVSAYTLGGTDFLGAGECHNCGGGGIVYVSPKDRLAMYPGGPFCGYWPGKYAELSSAVSG